MIVSFEDFCLRVYVIMGDFWQTAAHFFHRPGDPPVCTASALLIMVLWANSNVPTM